MDITRINQIVRDTTTVYRKGDVVTERTTDEGLHVVEVFGYPPVTEAPKAVVDLVFVSVGVDTEKAEPLRAELIAALGDGIGPETGMAYSDGPSYIHIGGDLGSQELALRFMALCTVLGIGELVTPALLGIDDEAEARQMAGMGLLYLVNLKVAA